MKVGLLIGGLGRGGSERQLSELAIGLAARGHTVEVVVYGGSGALDNYLSAHDVPVRVLNAGSRLQKVRAVRRWTKDFQPDVMHGFMKRASAVALMADLPKRRSRVVASDFSTATYNRGKPVLWAALAVFALADRVVTQTVTNRRSLDLLAPWLRKKTTVVRNGVDIERFRPVEREGRLGPFRFVSVGTVYRVKNPVRVVRAVAELRQRGIGDFRFDWYGRFGPGGDTVPSQHHAMAVEAARECGVEDVVTFHGETSRIETAYHLADALVHASVQEGIPNAVVEAMATGLPLVVSRVSDLPLIVAEGRNGFVCDETNPAAIADAMQLMLECEEQTRLEMSRRSRQLAVRWFGADRFVADYENLYESLISGIR